MKVAFDHQVFSNQRYGGISRYVCRLAEHLNNIEGVESRIIVPFHFNEYAAKLPREVISGIKVPRPPKSMHAFLTINQILFDRMIRRIKPDIVHDTYYWGRDTLPLKTKRVITCYDMLHEKFPWSFSKNNTVSQYKAIALRRSDHIICISESTKRDLLEIFADLPESKISVVYVGFENMKGYLDSVEPEGLRQFLDKPYILYVGSRPGYKNFSTLVKAYASSESLKSSFQIVAFGGGPFNKNETKLFTESGIGPHSIRQITGNDYFLAYLYHWATVFVYPSLYEGFGAPPLEAMSAGCPVACSNTSSLPEVVGDAAKYFDPRDPDNIASAISSLAFDGKERLEIQKNGSRRAALFSWQKCAEETLQIYQTLK